MSAADVDMSGPGSDQQQTPSFVLDELKHVEPMPGPVWRDRSFACFFCDAYVNNTDLLGFDQKKGGDIGALLSVYGHLLRTTANDHASELTSVGVSGVELSSLDKVIGMVKASEMLARQMAKVSTPDQFAQFLFTFKQGLRGLAPTEKIIIPGGWRNMDGGHSVFHVIERDESSYTFTVHNGGKGVEYHPSSVSSHPKTKYQTSLRFSGISAEKMLDDGLWYMLFKMQLATSDDHRMEVLYDVLLPHLLDACVGTAIERQQAHDRNSEVAVLEPEFRTAQRAEINYLKSMKECVHYLLLAEGWTLPHVKHLSFLLRRQMIEWTVLDLNQRPAISRADAKIMRLAAQNLARCANKESESQPRRLEADGLEEVWAQLQWLESQLEAKVKAHDTMPKLEMEASAKWIPFPSFNLFRRDQSVEQFSGWKKEKETVDLIDFLALPQKSSEFKHFAHVIDALTKCHSLCERLSTKSNAGSYYHRIALLQDFFCRLLPRPLPPYRSRKPTKAADGSEIPAPECLYASAIIDYATQLRALNLLLELAKHYVSSAKSVASNRALESCHVVTMATMVAVTDAIIRIPACDNTSIITLVLNGTEHKMRPKQKSFASPYQNMMMGHRQMQSTIAGFQQQLGRLGMMGSGLGGAASSFGPTTGSAAATSSGSNMPTIEVVPSTSAAPSTSSTAAPTSSSSSSSSTSIIASSTSSESSTSSSTQATSAASTSSSSSQSSTSTLTTTSSSTAAPVSAGSSSATVDADTQAKVAEAQRLLLEALSNMKQAKEKEKESMAAASQTVVTPIFYASLQNGRGMELAEMSEKLLLTQPHLAMARGEVLDYFHSQSQVGSKAIFTFPTRMNTSTYWGKDSPTMELVKILCFSLGYELNPDDEKNETMDDQVSELEAKTFYLTHPKSPFLEHQPEFFIYRDIIAYYHIMVAQTDHRRSIKIHRWNKEDATLKWRVKEVNRAKTMIDINIELCGEEAACLDSLPIYSAADAGSYVTDVVAPTEDDVLHSLVLPSFGDILSEEDAEQLLSYLTAPYIRLPLIISFFSTKDRIAVLLNRDVQNLVESVLFEPRRWVSAYEPPPITTVPAGSRAAIGAARGMLLNELIHAPTVLLDALLHMAQLTLDLNTGDYTSSSREIILFVLRLIVRVESNITFLLDHTDEVFAHHRQPTAEYLQQLNEKRGELRQFLIGELRKALIEWEEGASRDNELLTCCVIHAHMALLYRGVRAHEWDVDSVSAVLRHSAFLRTWYSPGVTGKEADVLGGQGQAGDDFFASNFMGMATRYGMSHMGRFGGGRGGYMSMMGRGGRRMLGSAMGDDEVDAEEDDGVGSSSSSRRGGRRGRTGRRARKEEGKDEEKEREKKKKGDESDEEDESDVHLPGLDAEEAVEQVKVKNPGEGKASALPTLEVPDQELFEMLQACRRGFITWLAHASPAAVDDVMQGCLAASTRSASVQSRWRATSNTPGIWRSSDETLEVNAQTAELFFTQSTITPVPNFVAQTPDYISLFGSTPLHCALVALHDNRYWSRIVGQPYSLKMWNRVERELVVVNQPTPNPQPSRPNVEWICFNDGQTNPMAAEGCSKCQRRQRPRFPHGFTFAGINFDCMFVPTPTQMAQHEKWIFDAVEPVLGALFGGRQKMAFEFFLPHNHTDPNAELVHLLGQDEMRTWREIIVHKQRGVCQIYSLLEHGRRMFRSLDYTSDTRFTSRYLEPNIKDRAFEWAPQVRHAAGRLMPVLSDSSLVITRDRVDPISGVTTEETYLPSRHLYGLLPSALLDHFIFWQQHDDSFLAFPRVRSDPTFFYRLHVRLIQLASDNAGQDRYDAIVTRRALDPDTIELEDPRTGDALSNPFDMKKQLDANDPLIVAINASKVATLKDQHGYGEGVANAILAKFDFDLPLAQSWIADPSNATEIETLKAASPAEQSAIAAAQSSSSSSSAFSISASSSHGQPQLILLNLLHAAPGTLLHRIGTLLTRVEDLSNILCWSSSQVNGVGDDVAITLIELPRLKLRLQPRPYTDEQGVSGVRLYSLDHANLYVSDYRDDMLNQLLVGLDQSLLMENNEHELFVLIPSYIVHRPNITSAPFSTELVPERGASTWMNIMETRFFLYPVHTSHTFLLTPTQSSAVYLILLRLLARQYTEAYKLVQSCEADMKLSESEEWILQQLEKAQTDFAPNAAAIRLKLSLVIMHSQTPFPWRVQDEYKSYLEKLSLVSAVCRLNVDEELYLLKHLRSGAEFEDLEAEDAEENELDSKPRHLDAPLANRLNVLTTMIAEEEQYEQELAGLQLDVGSSPASPPLQRTRSGRKQCPLMLPVQRGCRSLWSEVENAVDRFYSDFSFNSRTWDAQIEYNRPDEAAMLLGPAIKTLNGVWKDTITGLGRKLGFFFLAELLTGQVKCFLTDPSTSSAASLAKLLARLLFLKNTAWGVRFDLNVHRSFRERSFVPYVALALLERMPAHAAPSAPNLAWQSSRMDLLNGCSVSNREPEMSPAARYLESLLHFTQQFVDMPERRNDPRLQPHVVRDVETVVVPPLHSLLAAPQPSDFACNQRELHPFEHDEVRLNEDDCRCFSDQLLSCLHLDRYVIMRTNAQHVAASVPFDLASHPDAQSHVAKAMLQRTQDDVRVYAKMINEGKVPMLKCLLDEDVANILQLDSNQPLQAAASHPLIQSAIKELQALLVALGELAKTDYAQIPLAASAILELGNQIQFEDEDEDGNNDDGDVDMKDGDDDDAHLSRMRFMLARYSELKPTLSLDHLCACLLSTQLSDDLHAVNPYLPRGAESTVADLAQAFMLRVSRLGHVYRCMSMTNELISMLRSISHLSKSGEKGKSERAVFHRAVGFKSSALAVALSTRRFCFGPDAFVSPRSPASSLSPMSASPSPSALSFEPRYVLFEYLFNILLRQQQVKLLHTFLQSSSQVQQMIMGAGKTTVIGPLLALILADGRKLVTQVVPSALLEFSRGVMRSRFTHIITKRIHTYTFDRSVRKIRHITRLFDKLHAARKTRGVVITTPEAIKATFLKHIELLHTLESAPASLSQPAQLRLRIRSEMADSLASILQLWKGGCLILDEVDLLLHPLRSELNFPIMERQPLDLSPDRWELAIHALDAIFFAQYRTMSVPFQRSDTAYALLDSIASVIAKGIQQHAIQSSPHLVLLDAEWYHHALKQPLAQWIMLWLRSKQHMHVKLSDEDAITYLVDGPLGASKEVCQRVQSLHSASQRKVLHLSHDWISSFMPHVLAKIDRVSYGLLTAEDMQLVDPSMPNSRRLLAVPFIGKDVPSHASEFSHPDVLIGLTILAYRYEGMRRSDVRRVIAAMQRQMRTQVGPFSTRPASILFDTWCQKGKKFAAILHAKQLADEDAERRAEMQKDGAHASALASSSSTSSSGKLKFRPIVPLSIFQLSDRKQMRALFHRVRHLPDLIHHYLSLIIFPAVLQHQVVKLSASGQELGGSLLFDLRYGFSGTPSDLLPLELGSCGYEQGSEGNIMLTLTNDDIVKFSLHEDWSVRQLLSSVANSNAHALIDTGALITGFTNYDVAKYLLEHGLHGLDGCVFLDRQDRQMILLRSSWTVLPLAQCGIDPSKRFTFYDQVHTTGMDIKQALNAVAVVTLGKDMTFRDYAQGAFRMRGIGKGQTIHLFIISEVKRLIDAEVPAKDSSSSSLISSVAAWLTCNSMRSERLQFMQLQHQNLSNVWRKKAFDLLLLETTRPLGGVESNDDPRRFWRFQEIHSPEMLHLRRCIQSFRQPIDFAVQADITHARTFKLMLKEELEHNKDLLDGDDAAMAQVRKVEALASGSMENSTELQQRTLNQEMVNEQEQEQEQKKTVEQEEQSQVRFSREDEMERSWKVFELAKHAQPSTQSASASSSFSSDSSFSLHTPATVRESHPFYPWNEFSVRGVNERDIDLPSHIMLSSNFFRKEWAAMGQRRLKNITVVLEWMPKTRTATASSSSSSSTAMSDVPSPLSAIASSPLLTPAQESALKTAFKMFDHDNDGTITLDQLKQMMREVGEETSEEDVAAIGDKSSGALTFDDFKQFIMNRSASRTEMRESRYFVTVSLKEAESLRRLIHMEHPILTPSATSGEAHVAMGLRLLNGSLLDFSPTYKAGSSGQQSLALQTLRFIDCQCFFNDYQLSLLLKALQHNPPQRRLAFFENLLRCRRRDRRRFHDTPLKSIFQLRNEQELLSYRSKVARVRSCLKGLNLSLQDAFIKFDAMSDGFLNTTELAYALIAYLKLPLSFQDVQQLMDFGNAKRDGLMSSEEWMELLREPELVAYTGKEAYRQDRMQIDEGMEEEEDEDTLPSSMGARSPTFQRTISTTRLVLTPEYEKLYEEEERVRKQRIEQAEAEAAAEAADKAARELERKQLEEAQARDWQMIQEMRRAEAASSSWQCSACTFLNEPTAHFCVVCETRRPEEEKKTSLADMEDTDATMEGPAFWICQACSYSNDASRAECEMCYTKKPKQGKQKRIVTLWSCPICSRLVTSDRNECDVCTSDREAITAAPMTDGPTNEGTDYQSLFGNSLIGRGGVPAHVSELSGKVVALFFSADWSGPCRAFISQLSSIYQSARSANKPFEVVYVSADSDADSFNAALGSMPWRAIKFSDEERRKGLNEKFKVDSIPTLIILNQQGTVLTRDGRGDIRNQGDAAVTNWCEQAASSTSAPSNSGSTSTSSTSSAAP